MLGVLTPFAERDCSWSSSGFCLRWCVSVALENVLDRMFCWPSFSKEEVILQGSNLGLQNQALEECHCWQLSLLLAGLYFQTWRRIMAGNILVHEIIHSSLTVCCFTD